MPVSLAQDLIKLLHLIKKLAMEDAVMEEGWKEGKNGGGREGIGREDLKR